MHLMFLSIKHAFNVSKDILWFEDSMFCKEGSVMASKQVATIFCKEGSIMTSNSLQ
jgi:hypothetical protein